MPDLQVADVPKAEIRYRGMPASPGIAVGPLSIFHPHEPSIFRYSIQKDQTAAQWERLHKAIEQTRVQLVELKGQFSKSQDDIHARIFDVHLMVLEDQVFLDSVRSQLESRLLNVDYLYQESMQAYANKMRSCEDAYLQERATDVEDVARRVLSNLQGGEKHDPDLNRPCVVLAQDLSPSDTLYLKRNAVLGFVTEGGSRSSHAAIMARSLRIPAVVALQEDVLDRLEADLEVLIDGHEGLFIVNPSTETKRRYESFEKRRRETDSKLEEIRLARAVTKDGRSIILRANLERAEDIPLLSSQGAEGIGLYRTEFLYLDRADLPTEEEQAALYLKVAEAAQPNPVVFRTLDIGGDKKLACLPAIKESNPFLGWRGLRLCLSHPEILKTQLRALCRASVEGNVHIMFPMVTDINELRQARALLSKVQEELRDQKIPQAEKIECGIMVEVPSVAVMADQFAKEVDFFSIGTNDLIQYTLAVDRTNEKIANLYQPTHPAILRLIACVVEGAHRNKISVSICGEMASSLFLTPLLIGLGVDCLSVEPSALPRLKRAIQLLDYAQAQKFAQTALQSSDGNEVQQKLDPWVKALYPELL